MEKVQRAGKNMTISIVTFLSLIHIESRSVIT